MQIYVYSRQAFEAAKPHEVPHLVISITSHPSDVARLRANAMCRSVLRLAFVDAVEANAQFSEEVLFSPGHVAEVWDFVRARGADVERILVHCDAGVSRSSAVAAAIARRLNGDDAEFFGGRYRPNARVYRMLLEGAGGEGER